MPIPSMLAQESFWSEMAISPPAIHPMPEVEERGDVEPLCPRIGLLEFQRLPHHPCLDVPGEPDGESWVGQAFCSKFVPFPGGTVLRPTRRVVNWSIAICLTL